ncbi:conserved domain protein [Paraprevotella xylaniphila YIT 11841]|uniref:Conserved domain protein n=1 Tax=Paraprevotella xylaniphila YIT 11841 TaxID=762982 RepID=F3QYS0_9BACT|nr:conserved domain protein [Paraprevotella xylaniphila YIT 11841]
MENRRKCTFSSGNRRKRARTCNNAHPCFRRYLPLHCHPDDKRVTKSKNKLLKTKTL